MNIHTVEGKIQNIFIAEYPDKLLLLDGACRSDFILIKNFIEKKLLRKMSDLKLVVVTHMHPDHAGAAMFFRKKLNIPIAAFYSCDLWYSGFGGRIQHAVDIALAQYVALKKRKSLSIMSYSPSIKPDFELRDSASLPFFDDWRVIHTPGHTSHDICLYCAQDKLLYASDTIIEINSSFHLPFPVVFPNIMAQSFKKLYMLKVEKFLLAHGHAPENADFHEIIDILTPKLFQKKEGYFAFLKYFVKFTRCARSFEKKYNSK